MNKEPSKYTFLFFCLGAFLLSVPYSTTFLLPLLMTNNGGTEAHSGIIIFAAAISTIVIVLVAGHILDYIGLSLSVAIFSIFLTLSCLGFIIFDRFGIELILSGLLLGTGWGIFYTLGPIFVATKFSQLLRVKYFAFMSGSMMCGYASVPILGEILEKSGYPIIWAFYFALICGVIGGFLFYYLHYTLERNIPSNSQSSRLSFASVKKVFLSLATFPIVMVGILGCIFSGLSTFQTSYASSHGVEYSLFYIFFMVTVIVCRLYLVTFIVNKNPYMLSLLFSIIISISIFIFIFVDGNHLLYIFSSVLMGLGYGLIHSIINSIAANDAPEGFLPQTLLLYSLVYLFCAFSFPLISGYLIVNLNINILYWVMFIIGLVNCLLSVYRLSIEKRFVTILN